eukprot:SAG25_NODE_944_length_4650_cov_9.607119_8_plen_208_part_00
MRWRFGWLPRVRCRVAECRRTRQGYGNFNGAREFLSGTGCPKLPRPVREEFSRRLTEMEAVVADAAVAAAEEAAAAQGCRRSSSRDGQVPPAVSPSTVAASHRAQAVAAAARAAPATSRSSAAPGAGARAPLGRVQGGSAQAHMPSAWVRLWWWLRSERGASRRRSRSKPLPDSPKLDCLGPCLLFQFFEHETVLAQVGLPSACWLC